MQILSRMKKKDVSQASHNKNEISLSWFEALDGGPQKLYVDLKKENVTCLCHLFYPKLHVKFKKRPCPMSLHFYIACRMSVSPKLKSIHVTLSVLGIWSHKNVTYLLRPYIRTVV